MFVSKKLYKSTTNVPSLTYFMFYRGAWLHTHGDDMHISTHAYIHAQTHTSTDYSYLFIITTELQINLTNKIIAVLAYTLGGITISTSVTVNISVDSISWVCPGLLVAS